MRPMPLPVSPVSREEGSGSRRRHVGLLAVAATVVAVLVASLFGAVPGARAAAATTEVTALTTNGRVDPLGISTAAPSLGWQFTAAGRGAVQTAYEIRVGRTAGASDVWSSGRVDSAEQVDVDYAGPALQSATRYHWSVRIWDGDGQASAWSDDAWFETGLMSAADWGGAQWVGRPAVSYPTWTDYDAEIGFDLNAIAFGVFLRQQDARNTYMWQLNVGTSTNSVPSLVPHVMRNGQWTVLNAVDLRPAGFTRDRLLDGRHTIAFRLRGNTVVTTIDGVQVDSRAQTAFASGGIGVRTFGGESVTVTSVKVTSAAGQVLSQPSLATNPFSAGVAENGTVVVSGTVDASLIGADAGQPLLRTTFATTADKQVASARVYATARGVYELSLNGQKVGDQFLAPGYTEYATRIQSQTYDVTALVQSGRNAFGAALGDGWWAGKVGLAGKYQYGSDLSLLARLHIVYTDGSDQWVDSGDAWRWSAGPFLATDNQIGEVYDARRAQPGWNTAGFDAAAWSPVVTRPSATDKVSPQGDEPVRETAVLDARSATDIGGVRIFDLGQNMVGVPRVTITGRPGETVKLRHAEVLNPDGTLYTANLRAALATDLYTFDRAGTITYQPTFTQHGFRYIEVSGLAQLPDAAAVKGVVLGSDLPFTGTVTSDNALVNQLMSNIRWGARGNFLSIPTDTPARDERLGWTGDINIFSTTAAYLFDTRAFLAKWMTDVRDEQKPSGSIPSVIPSTNGAFDETGVAWEDAIITVPHSLWNAYGDTQIIRDNWAAMSKFFDYARASAGSDNLEPGRATWFSGDWLHLDDPSDQGVLGTAVWAQDVRMMADMARAVGRTAQADEYDALYQSVRASFTAAYVAADGTVKGNSQTGYALALGMDLVTDPALKAKAGEKYVAKLALTDDHLRTGFVGTPWLLPALSNIGREDLAYEILLKDTYPSWGYEISKGATTVWERWNSIQPDGSFGPVDMNSFNHYAYGAVGDWIAQNIAGIRIGSAGYRESIVAPRPGGGITQGGGTLDTVYGPLVTSWRTGASGIALEVTVPAGTTSEVRVPSDNAVSVLESGRPVAEQDGVKSVSYDADGRYTSVVVGSGTYSFTVSSSAAGLAPVVAALDAIDAEIDEAPVGDGVKAGLRGSVSDARSAVSDAVDFAAAGDTDSASTRLNDASTALAVLVADIAGLDIPDAARARLIDVIGAASAALTTATLQLLGITVQIDPAAVTAGPGETIRAGVRVANLGAASLSITGGTVTVGDVVATIAAGEVAAGSSAVLPFEVPVAGERRSGKRDAVVALAIDRAGASYSFGATVPGWLTLDSRLSLGGATAASTSDGSSVAVAATIANAGAAAATARLVVAAPDGWVSGPGSSSVRIAAGGSAAVAATVYPPRDVAPGSYPLSLAVVSGDEVVATGTTTVVVPEPGVPDAAQLVDWVDFGDAASETAHAVLGSPSSGTSSEAGLSRRYTNNNNPGSWFEGRVSVEPGQPILLRIRETWNSPGTKDYDVFIDGTKVRDVRLVRSGGGGQSSTIHQILVTDPAVLANSGSVVVRFQYPSTNGPRAFYDPSVADLWVLSARDATPPTVAAAIAPGAAQGAGDWYRGPVTVDVTAADDRPGALRLERSTATGWAQTPGSFTLSDDGSYDLGVRAVDAAGNPSATASVAVRIDTTAPVVQLVGGPSGRVPGGAGLQPPTCEASDATSGVRSCDVVGFSAETGTHTVTAVATDNAGNRAETSRTYTVYPTATPSSVGQAGTAGWYLGAVQTTLTSSDPAAAVEFRVDGGAWRAYAEPVSISSDGRHTLDYRVLVGGTPVAESAGAVAIAIDTAAPVTTAAVTPAGGTATVGQTATATFTASDVTSGVARTEYSVDGGAWTTGTRVDITDRGRHTVRYRSVDVAGNVEPTRDVTLVVADPATTAAVRITSADQPNADGWYQQNVLVALTAPQSGQKVQYSVNTGTWRTYSSAITVSSNGTTSIRHRLLENNVVVPGSGGETVVKLDKTAPSASATRTPSSKGTPRNPIAIAFAAQDATSGVASVEYRLNDGAWQTGTAVVLAQVGDWVVSYRATDGAGNVSSVKSTTAVIAPDPATTVSASSSVTAGAELTVSIAGFPRWTDVTISVGTTVVGTVLTDQNGSARITLRTPATLAKGKTALTASEQGSGLVATRAITVR